MFETAKARLPDIARRLSAILGGGMAIIFAGCASTGGGTAALAPPPIREALQFNAAKYGVCNAAVAVIKGRRLESVETAQGCTSELVLTPESVFEAASLSKPVFAYAVLKLVQEGKMDLDAPVLKYLPQGYVHSFQPYLADSASDRVSDQRLQAVTVRMVLNHTSGLPNWSAGPLAFDQPPGDKWHYSGEGYVFLQRAVEAVTGEKLDAVMAHRVFEPLGMTHSEYTRKPRLEKFIVPGSTWEGTTLRSFPFQVPVAAFTLYTSAQDYGRFLTAVLNDERTLRQIVDASVPVNPQLDLNWGLGWGVERHADDAVIWHWGNNPGYRAFVMASTRTGDGFVVLTSNERGLALAEPLGERIVPGGPHKTFRFHLLRDGLANLLCETVDICL